MSNVVAISIFRVIIYLWVGIEFGNLAFLYIVGYKNVKTTPIIKALQMVLFTLSLLFLYLSILPILLEVDPRTHRFLLSLMPFVLIPVGICARKFRCESLRRQTMKLPKKNEDER